MKNWQAFKTHARNQEHARQEEQRAKRGTRKGMRPGDSSSGDSVVYCGACSAPIVDSPAGRKRHALRGGKCAQAMKPTVNLQ